MTHPNRQRVSVQSTARMVTLQGELVPATGEATTLYGWAHGLGPVPCVVLDDGRALLIASKDLQAVTA